VKQVILGKEGSGLEDKSLENNPRWDLLVAELEGWAAL
jgi:hypothetical protein